MIGTLRVYKIQMQCKIYEKKLIIGKKIFKVHMENVHKRYKCDECGKYFTHNIGLKGHITDDHKRKDSIVINVAKFLLEDVI